MNSSDARAHERLLRNPDFWEMFLPLFCDEEKVREFAGIIEISEERIRAARAAYLHQHHRKMLPYFYRGNGTVN